MAAYDELEHEGDEEFTFQNRENEKQVKKKIRDKADTIKLDQKERLQEEWLSVENTYVWSPLDLDG